MVSFGNRIHVSGVELHQTGTFRMLYRLSYRAAALKYSSKKPLLTSCTAEEVSSLRIPRANFHQSFALIFSTHYPTFKHIASKNVIALYRTFDTFEVHKILIWLLDSFRKPADYKVQRRSQVVCCSVYIMTSWLANLIRWKLVGLAAYSAYTAH